MTTPLLRPRTTTLGAALLSVSLVFAVAASAQETRTVQADNGAIVVPANPHRVVAIGNTSLPFIDLGGVPLGVTTMRSSALALLPAEQRATYEAAVNLGPSGGEVDLERLASLAPDVIVAQMPAAAKLDIRSDQSVAIRHSVDDVQFTLLLTIGLVVLVIFLFLRNLSATVIPSLALPVSIVATFAVMTISRAIPR